MLENYQYSLNYIVLKNHINFTDYFKTLDRLLHFCLLYRNKIEIKSLSLVHRDGSHEVSHQFLLDLMKVSDL